ncbi:MAG: transglutaminase family protein [Deltaproteobacteria bacterium]|nr:transglutaminase family protein [Deltaproteobacteria bacterium]
MRILLRHRSLYRYDSPASLGPHLIRLRPAAHARARIETYSLRVTEPGQIRWQQDPAGNHVARVTWGEARIPELEVAVELAVDVRPVNPFDFTLDAVAETMPFVYGPLQPDLSTYLDLNDPAYACGPLTEAFFRELPKTGPTVQLVVELNRLIAQKVRYVIREEPGLFTPEQTLREGRGSCRDSAVLLIAALRSRGLAARFASGYLVQLTDEGMLPDQPKGVSRDVADLHAWAEVFLPGAGWIGLDATSGLLCGEGHIPLACSASPALASPLEGTTDRPAESVEFEMRIGRLGHEVRPTLPFTDEAWDALVRAGRATDERLKALGIQLTTGGEPTFNSRLHPERAEWNGDALGPTKWSQGLELTREIRKRVCPGAAVLLRQGKHYPGESLPRWTLELIARRDGVPLWPERGEREAWAQSPGGAKRPGSPELLAEAKALAEGLARRLGLDGFVHEALEDPWRFLQDEASLPRDTDPLKANLTDSEERRRLARVLDRGLATPAGYVLPILHDGGEFRSERWDFRRGRLFLLQGDAPLGLRLPLASLSPVAPAPPPWEEPIEPPDPRGPEAAKRAAEEEEQRLQRLARENKLPPALVQQRARRPKVDESKLAWGVRTALCVEPRDGALYVFLPPVSDATHFLELLRLIDLERAALRAPVLLEG